MQLGDKECQTHNRIIEFTLVWLAVRSVNHAISFRRDPVKLAWPSFLTSVPYRLGTAN